MDNTNGQKFLNQCDFAGCDEKQETFYTDVITDELNSYNTIFSSSQLDKIRESCDESWREDDNFVNNINDLISKLISNLN